LTLLFVKTRPLKRIYLTVTNDLNYDQRMARICGSLAGAGYAVTLVGRKNRNSQPTAFQPYRQVRLNNWFRSGKLFYPSFNIQLFFYLLFRPADLVCAIDLDTILPCLVISRLKKIPRVYDAHELFCEMKEVVTRPQIHRLWKAIEKKAVPQFKSGYTVSEYLAGEFLKMYGVHYGLIRNMAVLDQDQPFPPQRGTYILYQGAVNEGRSFETLIPAMREVALPLIVCGDGNFMNKARALVTQYHLEDKVKFTGPLLPSALAEYTKNAAIGVTLFEKAGLSNYYSLANRFFDYLQACIPQVCVDYPAYRQLNDQYRVAVLIDDLSPENIASQLNNLLKDRVVYEDLRNNCMKARLIFNWSEEEKKLIAFYRQMFSQ